MVILLVHIASASKKKFRCVPTIYVLSINKFFNITHSLQVFQHNTFATTFIILLKLACRNEQSFHWTHSVCFMLFAICLKLRLSAETCY